MASASPATAATRKPASAARFTVAGRASPDPTSRTGPVRAPGWSVPRTPSE